MRSYRTIYNSIRNISATGGLLAVMFLHPVPVDASNMEAFLQVPDSVLTIGTESSTGGVKKEQDTSTETTASASGTDTLPRKSPFLKLQSMLETLGLLEVSQSEPEDEEIITSDDMSTIRVAKVSDMSATLAWSSPKLTKITVYYSPLSPVLVSDKTSSASPWKFWNPKQVTLRGLSPDTVYHYKIVAVTSLGTTTSAEASFKTVAR